MEIYNYLITVDRTQYSITLTTRQILWEDFAPVFDAVVESFEITSPDAVRAAAIQPAGQARLGDNAGEVSPGGFQLWTYDGQKGEILNIGAAADSRPPQGPDTRLIIRDPDGRVIAENDDSGLLGFDLNAYLAQLELPETGVYEIEVHTYPGFISGDYTLTIESGPATEERELRRIENTNS
jgi:hypothetical protein